MEKKNYHPLTFYLVRVAYKTLSKKASIEPLPPFEECADVEKIKSIINTVESRYFGYARYPTVVHKAAAYLYLVNKDHPFFNGNKRMSVMLAVILLTINGYELDFTQDELSGVVLEIATKVGGETMSEDINNIAGWIAERAWKDQG